MVRKTIKAVLKRKLNDWANSVKDEGIKFIIKNKTIITGGAIVSMLQSERPKDFDIYFTDIESAYRVALYYAKLFNERKDRHVITVIRGGKDIAKQLKEQEATFEWTTPIKPLPNDRIKIYIRSSGVASEKETNKDEEVAFEDVYDIGLVGGDAPDIVQEYSQAVIEEEDEIVDCNICSNQGKVALSNRNLCHCKKFKRNVNISAKRKLGCDNFDKKREYYRPIFFSMNAITLSDRIQIVTRFFGEAEKIHENYDFVHCTCYWQGWDNTLVLPEKALESIINKQLIYQGSKYPVCSIMRMRKFISRGWAINAGQILKILWQVSELDLTDIDTLEEQLVEVDSAYFSVLVEVLRNQANKNADFKVERTYVYSIIDKIFG